jgi:hypothetical protein
MRQFWGIKGSSKVLKLLTHIGRSADLTFPLGASMVLQILALTRRLLSLRRLFPRISLNLMTLQLKRIQLLNATMYAYYRRHSINTYNRAVCFHLLFIRLFVLPNNVRFSPFFSILRVQCGFSRWGARTATAPSTSYVFMPCRIEKFSESHDTLRVLGESIWFTWRFLPIQVDILVWLVEFWGLCSWLTTGGSWPLPQLWRRIAKYTLGDTYPNTPVISLYYRFAEVDAWVKDVP